MGATLQASGRVPARRTPWGHDVRGNGAAAARRVIVRRMATHAPLAAPAGAGVGALLRGWRQRRRLSQLDLALEAEISTRHLSFLETGRAQPSRGMVLRLAEQLGVPLRERNALLVAA